MERNVLKTSYKYLLKTNKTIEKKLDHLLYFYTIAFNQFFWYEENNYKQGNKFLSEFDLNKLIPNLKETFPELKNVYSMTLNNVSKRISEAFKHFFRRCKEGAKEKGYPQPKIYHLTNSFTYPRLNDGIKIKDDIVTLSLGNREKLSIRFIKHRELDKIIL